MLLCQFLFTAAAHSTASSGAQAHPTEIACQAALAGRQPQWAMWSWLLRKAAAGGPQPVHRACDLLEVPLGGGGECNHRTHILVYISDGATPSYLHGPYSPLPSGPYIPPRGLENRHGPHFLSQSSLSLSHRTLQGGKGGQRRHSSGDSSQRWKNSVVFPAGGTCPCPSAPGRSNQSNGLLGRQREIPSLS